MVSSGRQRARCFAIAVVLLLTLTPSASGSGPPPEPDLGETPTKCGGGGAGGCYGRDVGPNSMDDTSLGDFSISPHLVHVGETITGKISPAVHFGENVLMNFPVLGDIPGLEFEGGEEEEAPSSTNPTIPGLQPDSTVKQVCQDGAPTRTVTSCTWKVTGATGGWARASASIGNPPARGVEQDYYAVSADGWGISGRVSTSDGHGMAGVSVSVSGSKVMTKNPVRTNKAGEYYFLVGKGTYTVTVGAAVCVEPKGDRCSASSKPLKVPSSHAVNFKAAEEGLIEGHIRDSNAAPIGGVTVHIVGKNAGPVVTTDGQGYYSATVPEGTYTLKATQQIDVQETDDSGQPVTVKKERTFCAARTSGTSGQGCLRSPRVKVPPDQMVDFTPEDDPGILVAIRGDKTIENGFLHVRVTLSNPGDVVIANMKYVVPHALSTVSIGADNQPISTPVLTRVEGPEPKPPTSLAADASVSLDYKFVAVAIGQAELAVDVEGEQPGHDGPVKGTAHAMATVTDRDVTEADVDNAIVDGIEDAFAEGAKGLQALDAKVGQMMQATSNFPTDVTAAEVTATQELGLPRDLAGFQRMSSASLSEFLGNFGTKFLDNVHADGQAGGQAVADVVAVLEDPVARRELSEKTWEFFKNTREENRRNQGYLAQAILATYTLDGWRNILTDNAALAQRTAESVYDAGVGALELRQADIEAQRANPKAYSKAVADAYADGTYKVVKEVMVGVAGEGVQRGTFAVGSKIVGGLRNLRGAGGVVNATEAAVGATGELTGAGAMSEATRRMALGDAASRTIQELPYGTALDEAALVEKAGFLAEDARAISNTVEKANTRWPGLDLEITARTSEVLSGDIDGWAKREFVKPKAVSSIDKLLGLEDSFGGRAAVKKNIVRPSDEALEALEYRNPGITKKIDQRIADQEALYRDEWDTRPKSLGANATPKQIADAAAESPKYEKSLRFLVDESAREGNEKGITVLVSRPGQELPHGIRYLEQLDQEAWRTAKGVSEVEASQLKRELARHPDQSRVKLTTEEKNGTITFIEGLSGKPVVSDLDLQSVRPRNGVWPKPPPTRADVENFVKRELGQNVNRFPFHGWSDSAVDLPSSYYKAAAKFEMGNASSDPVIARAAAQNVARKFRVMAKVARHNADRITETAISELEQTAGGRAQAAALRAKKEKLLQNAKEFDKFSDADVVAKEWPTGEKVVSFTSSGPRVAAGTAGR